MYWIQNLLSGIDLLFQNNFFFAKMDFWSMKYFCLNKDWVKYVPKNIWSIYILIPKKDLGPNKLLAQNIFMSKFG